jgi:hypothetical protein
MQPVDHQFEHDQLMARTVVSIVGIFAILLITLALVIAVNVTERNKDCVEAGMQWVDGNCVDEVTP